MSYFQSFYSWLMCWSGYYLNDKKNALCISINVKDQLLISS